MKLARFNKRIDLVLCFFVRLIVQLLKFLCSFRDEFFEGGVCTVEISPDCFEDRTKPLRDGFADFESVVHCRTKSRGGCASFCRRLEINSAERVGETHKAAGDEICGAILQLRQKREKHCSQLNFQSLKLLPEIYR